MSTIACCGEDFEAYVDECYHISTFAKVYAPIVVLITGPSLGPRTRKVRLLVPEKL